jgi:hypothetical protein
VAKLGADGPARRSSLLSLAWRMGPPPIPRRRPPRATNRMTRPPRRSPPQEAARGFWIRAWGQREPTLQGTGRSHSSALWQSSRKGGLDIPASHAKCSSLRIRTPGPDVDALRFSHRVVKLSYKSTYATSPVEYCSRPRDASTQSIKAVATMLSMSNRAPHSLKVRFVEITIDPASYRAATTWNNRSVSRLSMGASPSSSRKRRLGRLLVYRVPGNKTQN